MGDTDVIPRTLVIEFKAEIRTMDGFVVRIKADDYYFDHEEGWFHATRRFGILGVIQNVFSQPIDNIKGVHFL